MFNQQTLKQHSLPLALALAATLLAIAGDSMTELLRYQASEVKAGEMWRLVSANLVHLGWSHTLMNLLGLGLIWGLFLGSFSNLNWLLVILLSSMAGSLGLLLLNPDLVWYVGLAGVLQGLGVAGAVGASRRGDNREAILLAAIVGKLLWEQSIGALPGSADMAGGPVVVDSHLYGAIGGALAGLLLKPLLWCKSA